MKKIFKKIILYIMFTKILHSMDPEHWINTERINNFLKTEVLKKTETNFRAGAQNAEKKYNLSFKIQSNNNFFTYGHRLKTMFNKIFESKKQAFLTTLQEDNHNKNIVLETSEEWEHREKKIKANIHGFK